MSYNVFIVVLIGILFGNTVASILPYGCVECYQKGFIYCRSGVSPNQVYNCYKSVDSCAATSDQIVGRDLCPNVSPAQCADHNYDCATCVATSGCKMCASTGQFCMPSTAPCLDTVVATNLAGCSTSNYQAMVACNAKTDCASCVSTGCYYIPDKSTTPFPKGCSSINSDWWNAVSDCSDPTVICPLRTSGNPSDMCNCVPDVTDTKCTLCYGSGPTAAETNYKCTERDLPDCTTVSNDCHNANLTCPPLINKFDPYGTRANCITNDQCSICVTKPVSSITPSTLKCVSTASSPTTCSALTRDPNDAKIICPTRLTCTDCAATAGCSWCSSGDMLFSSSCAATGNCGTNQVADNTCTDNCSSFKTCATCPTASCSWCANSEFGLQRCVKQCTTTTTQQKINCAQANSCSNYNDDCQSCITGTCTYCNGNGRNDGGNPGNWCSSVTNCNNVAGCGEWEPCLAVPVSSTANCKSSFCTQYQDCLSCAGQTDEIQHCYWCDNKGTRYCDAGCNNGTATRVSNCAVFGPTTGGLPTGTSGQTGSPSTGSSGIPPPSPAPSPSPTPSPKNPSPSPTSGTSPSPTPSPKNPSPSPTSGPSPTPNPKTPSPSPTSGPAPSPTPNPKTPSPSSTSGGNPSPTNPSPSSTTGGLSPSPTTGGTGPQPGSTPQPSGPSPGGSGPQPGSTPQPSGPQPGGSGPQPGGSGPQPGGSGPAPSPGGGTPQPAKGFVNSFNWMLGAILVVLVYMGHPM